MNNNELTDMLQVYFECNKNSAQAERLYANRFPNRNVPQRRKFKRLEDNLRMYGAFKKPTNSQRIFNDTVELDVLLSIEENPQASTREIASGINSSKDTVHKILKKHKFKSYIPQKVQVLEDNDRARRQLFCQFYLNMIQQDAGFWRKIIWSDECTFGNNGIFNRNINRYWCQENPRRIVETNYQRRFSVNLWCGILDNQIIGPFFIDGTLNQEKYYRLLSENLANFLDTLPIAELFRIYFQQDGATPHNARRNIDWLNANFDERWIGTSGPIQWPARSPDLTPADFWLWGYLKDRVFSTHPENINILRERIINVCREIPPNFISNATYAVAKRCQLCILQDGGQFEQYL